MNDVVTTVNSLSGLISCLGMPAFMGVLAYAVYYAVNQNQNKQFASWETFAEKNGLTYKSSKYFPSIKPKVTGIYRGCKLNLSSSTQVHYEIGSDHDARRDPQILTCMILQTDKATEGEADEKYAKTFLNSASLRRLTRGKLYTQKQGTTVVYEQNQIEQDEKNLEVLFESLYDLIKAYSMIVTMGGKIIPSLQTIGKNNQALQQVMGQLLFDISQTTTKQLKRQASELLCSSCLVYCSAHKIDGSWHMPVNYYGCRACGQSQNFLETKKRRVVAVLDNTSSQKILETETMIRVNWLSHRKVFDFDEVEIHRVTDKEAELFAIQVGNDTDPLRRSGYKTMSCNLSADCRLSENTIRMLQRTFGKVEIIDL
jgi:hypothetical protein